MSERFTVVGSRGFIGSALVAHLAAAGCAAREARHTDDLARAGDLGHVVYCSGIAASGAAEAGYAFAVHVEGLRRLLEAASFRSLLYLSSTRVYGASTRTDEDAPLAVEPAANDVYRISKIAGEALALADPRPTVRVARLSNVAGPSLRSPLFFSDVLRQAAERGTVEIRTAPASSKDYLLVEDACRALIPLALGGRHRLYNVASGVNVDNAAIAAALQDAGVRVHFDPQAAAAITPPIETARLRAEVPQRPRPLLDAVPELLAVFRAAAAASA